ncbi:NAD(P)H nitroreductase [Bacteroidia bacterium]|nr:NAD(P)H nitroreductase [Bacteroidia bacterium]
MNTKKEVLSTIFSRKSVRNFTDKKVSKEDLELLLKAGMAAPSGKDRRPWDFFVISNKEILDKMAEELPFAKMLKNVNHAIIVCGDSDKSDYWFLDCSAATQNILLAAEAMGLGSTWTAAYPYRERIEVIKKNIEIQKNITPLNIIPIGYPKGIEERKDKWDPSRVHWVE